MRFFYSVFFYLAVPFIFLRLWWRGRLAPAYRKRWSERLAYFDAPSLNNAIWVHAVSYGEMIVAAPLIHAIQKEYPNHSLVVTTTTPTGSLRVTSQFKAGEVFHVYLPYDTPGAVKRFLKKTNPVMAIFVETELWPNMFHYCHKKNIPIMIANARLSQHSANGYKRFGSLTRKMLSAVSILAAQAKPDAHRFAELGMDPKKIAITGNIKFDINDPDAYREQIEALRNQCGNRFVWVAGSTHPGEEEIILEAHRLIKERYPEALLILVPRKPERFGVVTELCREKSYRVVRRTEQGSAMIDADIYIGDTMGEMMIFYGAADVVFVGGSLVPVGGHNFLEPASLAKPLISGLHTFNFSESTMLLSAADALYSVETAVELADCVKSLFYDQALSAQRGVRALGVVESRRGALAKHMRLLQPFLK